MERKKVVGFSVIYQAAKLLFLAGQLAGSAIAQERETPARKPAPAPINIIADNVNRAAATAAQLLEILNKDSGLMVEFKQLLARDAGINGQVLEEMDLDEAAIAERLRSDLRVRSLATALLRKYGYLVPRINPDSELAAEHGLVLRERAQHIERAAERGTAGYPQTQPEYAIVCKEPSSRTCASPQIPARSERPLSEEVPVDRRNAATPLLRAADVDVPDGLQPDALTGDRELPASFTLDDPSQSLLGPDGQVSRGPKGNPSTRDAARDVQNILDDRTLGINNTLAFAGSTPETPNRRSLEFSDPTLAVGHAPALTENGRSELRALNFEPVHNPYADVPSLYDLYLQASPSGKKMERFGLEVFRRGTANPDLLPMDLPVGPDYVVGPGDGLSLNLWGSVSERLFRTVDREGRVVLPEVGAVLVAGRTLASVQEEVQNALRTQFRHISADVSLLRLRTVRVYVVGEVASPGAYDISSLSTPLNALFAAGGVTPSGSLRKLEHFRGKQLVEEVDAYDLLLHGIRGDVQRLENGDSLRVPSLGLSVAVDGMVRRPATYELRREKNLGEVLELAGGILPAAALQHIEVQRLQAHEKRTMLSLEVGESADKEALHDALENFLVQDSDEIHIFPIAPYNSDAVFLEGHVLRPGRYSYREGMKLKDLVSSYKDLLPEPAERYAEIIHIAAPDYRPVVESFRLADALEHPESGPAISPLDTVRIFGRYDFESAPEVLVTGEVHAPGHYRTSGLQRLRDALYQAGGVTPDAWLEAGQVFREQSDGTTHVFSVNLRNALRGDPSDNLVVEPRDRILIHRQPLKVSPATVTIRGEVARPGRYPLTDGMRISDLLQSAGGFLRSANATHSDLNHYEQKLTENSSEFHTAQKVDLIAALGGAETSNLPLRDGDVLTVPQQPHWKDMGATASVSGEVGSPGTYGIQPGERISSLLRRAGGLLPSAYPQAAELERTSVRERQEQSRQELIQRLEQESVLVKTSVSTSGSEEAALRQSAIQQKERVLEALRRAPVSGRLVVHLLARKDFAGSSDDIELRAGDTLRIPKQPGFVLVIGQVFNSNAITFRAGKNAQWYLSRAGGPTPLANKNVIFILRSDGEVTGSGGRLWSGGALRATINPGDTIVVPEKPVLGAGNTWKNIVAIAQIAQAGALAAAVAIP